MGRNAGTISKCNLWGVDLLILVTLGTQNNSFVRLLEEIQKLIDEGVIQEQVIVQAGTTKFKSEQMEILDFIAIDKFDELMQSCDTLITHGGVGSIITGLNHNKKVIAVPRYQKYGEHVNDHQMEIVENFNDKGYIIGLKDVSQLKEAFEKLNSFVPQKYKSNTANMIKLVKSHIDQA